MIPDPTDQSGKRPDYPVLRLERGGEQRICLSCACFLINLEFPNIYRHSRHQIKAEYHCFHFYFLDTDSSLTIQNNCEKFYLCLYNTLLEGSMSQNFELCLSFYFRP